MLVGLFLSTLENQDWKRKGISDQRRGQDFGSGGNVLGGRPSRGSGGQSLPDAGEF